MWRPWPALGRSATGKNAMFFLGMAHLHEPCRRYSVNNKGYVVTIEKLGVEKIIDLSKLYYF